MRQSKFSSNSEAINSFGAMRRRMEKKGIMNAKVASSDTDTYEVNKKILSDIKTLYEQAMKATDQNSVYVAIVNIQKGIQKMEQMVKKAGIDIEGNEKNDIINDINRAKSMLDLLKLTKI